LAQIFAFLGLLAATAFTLIQAVNVLMLLTSDAHPYVPANQGAELLKLAEGFLVAGFFWWLRRWAMGLRNDEETLAAANTSAGPVETPGTRVESVQGLRARKLRLTASIVCFVSWIVLYFAWSKDLFGLRNIPKFPVMLALFFLGPLAAFFALQAATGIAIRDVPAAWKASRWWQSGLISFAVVMYVFFFLFGFLAVAIGVDYHAVP
jgi:hypothetical protein